MDYVYNVVMGVWCDDVAVVVYGNSHKFNPVSVCSNLRTIYCNFGDFREDFIFAKFRENKTLVM